MDGALRNHGVHVYAGKLLAYFREMAADAGVEIAPYVSSTMENEANALPAGAGFQPRQTGLLKFSRLWRFGGACALTALQRADLVFSPHCTSVYPLHLAPVVSAIHDITPVVVPWKSKRITQTLRFCLWSAAKFSRAIVVGSENTKADMMRLYGVPESKLSVIYYGYDREFFNTNPADQDRLQGLRSRFTLDRPYIFHYGAIKPNKNLVRLIEAYRLIRSRNKNLEFDVVLAGIANKDDAEDVIAAAQTHTSSKFAGKVVLAGALSAPDLTTMLKGATLVVIPSLYEGFCLPMVESMESAIPTIASSSSCLPEVSGGVLRYFDPHSVEEMAFRIEEAMESEDLRKELAAKGRERAGVFCWERCARETLAVLSRTAARN